ncbi:hypothetical protein, partial [Corallococcus sp. AB049A]|uniref:hypothetical protein n=1 Tax=Corallococcus sp. AB049A TaxID=2316721 RepID=UPI001F245727
HRNGVQKVFYMDSPYEGTTGYRGVPPFDHDKYWNLMRELSRDHMVFISEYIHPDDFVPVETFNSRITLSREDKTQTKSEYLLVHESRAHEYITTLTTPRKETLHEPTDSIPTVIP